MNTSPVSTLGRVRTLHRAANASRPVIVSLLTVFVAVLTLLVGTGAAQAKVPTARRMPTAIESSYTDYVPQRGCDQSWTKRPGTEKLVALLKKTYPNVYAQGGYKCGTDGSTSEHYEGRAIDWMASASHASTRAEANAMVGWLLATDSHGNRFANARRLGVMYVIWNNRMLGSWDWKWHDYNGCMAKKMQTASHANACHRTHVHISLTWNGAMGRTTFWGHAVTPTDFGICKKKARYTGYRSHAC